MDIWKNALPPAVAGIANIILLLNTPVGLAATPPCGTTLTENTRLDSDMNCPDTALRLTGAGSKKVKLDCDGYSISTTTGSAIIVSNVKSATIQNCDVHTDDYFSHGILLTDGTSKTKVQNNTITTLGESSRGIEIRGSSKNKITDNRIQTFGSNGASAVSIRSGSNNNLVQDNLLDTAIGYPVNIQSSNRNKIYDNTMISPNGYLFQRSLSLQNGGLGIDASDNIYAIENNWGSSNGIGVATAFFRVDSNSGLGDPIFPVTMGGKDIGLGFDALDVLPDGTVLALPGCCLPDPTIYSIDPLNGNATAIPLINLSGSGKINGLEATSDTSVLGTSNTGELFDIDLDTGNVTLIGKQGTGWTDVAAHPTNGTVYAVSRRRDEISNSAHLYEIYPATGQIDTEIGDTGLTGLSSIDFSSGGILYGNADGQLVTIDITDASVTGVGSGFGPDPLEPMPNKNIIKNNLFLSDTGDSLRFPGTITLPTEMQTDISTALVEILPNQVMVDSATLPFLDESAQITFLGLTGIYRNLLVDPEDDGSFELCGSPQCEHISFQGGNLVFEVDGFSAYSSEENTNPTLGFIVPVVRAEIKALLSTPGISKKAKRKLKAAEKDILKALKFLKNGNTKNQLIEIRKAVADLIQAQNKGAPVDDLISGLVVGVENEAQGAIDETLSTGGNPELFSEAKVSMTLALDMLAEGKPDKAITYYQKAWVNASKSMSERDGTGNKNNWGIAETIETDNSGDANSVQIVMDNVGNGLAVWHQFDGTRNHIWANRYEQGTGWGTAELIETEDGTAVNPQVAMDNMGNAVAVWQQFDGTQLSIWFNYYTYGVGWDTAELIESITTDTGYAANPQIKFDAAGNAVSVWEQHDGTRKNIWANRFTAGEGWGSEELIESNDFDDAEDPQIVVDDAGNAIVVWVQYGTPANLWTNQYTVGAGWGTAGPIIGAGGITPKLAIDDTETVHAVWSQVPSYCCSWSVYYSRYTSSGGWETPVIIDAIQIANDPQIAVDNEGNITVVSGHINGSFAEIWAQRFNPDIGWNFLPEKIGSGWNPQVIAFDSGNAVAVWERVTGPSQKSIEASIFKPRSGWSNPELIEIEAGTARTPQIASSRSGTALTGWTQYNGSVYDAVFNVFD